MLLNIHDLPSLQFHEILGTTRLRETLQAPIRTGSNHDTQKTHLLRNPLGVGTAEIFANYTLDLNIIREDIWASFE